MATKPEPLGRRALASLREAILSGRMPPGERLVEEKLSAEFGMSRVQIREAIQQLIAEGLAVPVAGARGAQVAELTEDFARDLIEVRAVLEGLTARLAARHCDATAINAMLEQGATLAARADEAGLAEMNAAFHDMLAEAGANRALREVMRPLRERTEPVFRRNSAERAGRDWQEHAMILQAIAEGDEELAALLAARHVRRAALMTAPRKRD